MRSWFIRFNLLAFLSVAMLAPGNAAAQLTSNTPQRLLDGFPSCFTNLKRTEQPLLGPTPTGNTTYFWTDDCKTNYYICFYDTKGDWWYVFTAGQNPIIPTPVENRVMYFIVTTRTFSEYEAVKSRCSVARREDTSKAALVQAGAPSQLLGATNQSGTLQAKNPPFITNALGQNATKVLMIDEGGGFSMPPETRGDRRTILHSCEKVLETHFLHIQSVGQDSERAAYSAAYRLSGAIIHLHHARNGNVKALDDELRAQEAWTRNNSSTTEEIDLCFLRAAKELVSGSAAKIVDTAAHALPPRQMSDAERLSSVRAYSDEVSSLLKRFPFNPAWGEHERKQYALFINVSALSILEKLKSRMLPADYDYAVVVPTNNKVSALAACPSCKPEYPQVAPTPSTSPNVSPSEVGAIGILENTLPSNSKNNAPANQAMNRQPVKITAVAALGNGCVTAIARNWREHEIDKNTQIADLVLKNSCTKPQVAMADVSGFGMLGWPAIYNLGSWASTANADIPAGIPFRPIISMAEGGNYMIPANGEHVAERWQVPKPNGMDNEMKIWTASCDAYSPSGMKQVIFRPALHFANDSRAFCGPSRIRM